MIQTAFARMTAEAKACRSRLMHPDNAVPDCGIDLRRHSAPEPPPPPPDQYPHLPPPPVSELLVELRTVAQPTSRLTPRRKLQNIVGIIAEYYKVPRCKIYGKSRKMCYVIPRHVCCYFASEYLHHSISSIGRDLNYADHTTVLFAIKKVAWRMHDDTSFTADIASIWQIIQSEVGHG